MFDKKPKGEYVRQMSVSLQVCHSFMTNLMISGHVGALEKCLPPCQPRIVLNRKRLREGAI
jgi:hypothetical protein